MFVGIVLPNLNLIRFPISPTASADPDESEGKESQPQWLPRPQHQRKATAQKAAATRRRNAAKRSQFGPQGRRDPCPGRAEHPPGRSGRRPSVPC